MSVGLSHQAEALGAALPPLLIDAERLASTVSLGVHGRRKTGMGESFWQFRRYRQEDAAVAIDWRQSAKTQHLFVREREWEAAQSVWMWCDRSAAMQFESNKITKAERASVLTLALATLLVRGGERIALAGADSVAASSRAALRRAAHTLGQKDDRALPPDAPISKNSGFVWVSDFLSPYSEIETALRHLSHGAVAGVLLHIVDPAEEDFPFSGRTRFETLRGDLAETVGRAEAVAEGYRLRFKAHVERVGILARQLGWSHIVHRTDRPAQVPLIALYADMSGT